MKTPIVVSLLGTVTAASFLSATTASAFTIIPASESSLSPDLLELFAENYVQTEREAFEEAQVLSLSPAELRAAGGDIEVYFLDEGAGMFNDLYGIIGDSPKQKVFEAISCLDPNCKIPEEDGWLNPGYGVNLGPVEANTLIDFALAPAGSKYDPDLYSTNPVHNPDGLPHAIAYAYQEWTIFAFEDLYGPLGGNDVNDQESDRDFNDIVFAVKGLQDGTRPLDDPTDIPEPSSILSLFGVGLFGIFRWHNRSQK